MGVRCPGPRSVVNMTTITTMVVVVAVMLMMPIDAVEIMFRNACGKEMILSNGKTTDKIKKDGSLKKTLPVGAVEAFRLGTSNQATLAEFSVQETTTWYDVGIIPTGTFIGPGNCSSLDNCKAVTGGTGFNVAMKIIPGLRDDAFYEPTCRTVNCVQDGCDDAYQHPNDPGKTRNCPSDVHFTVVFCATPSTGSTDGSLGWNGEVESAVISQPRLTATPTTAAPPSPPPLSVTTSHADDGGDGTSVAVIIAAIIGGFVTIFASVILVRRWRYMRLEKMNDARFSSDAILYVEARDTVGL